MWRSLRHRELQGIWWSLCFQLRNFDLFYNKRISSKDLGELFDCQTALAHLGDEQGTFKVNILTGTAAALTLCPPLSLSEDFPRGRRVIRVNAVTFVCPSVSSEPSLTCGGLAWLSQRLLQGQDTPPSQLGQACSQWWPTAVPGRRTHAAWELHTYSSCVCVWQLVTRGVGVTSSLQTHIVCFFHEVETTMNLIKSLKGSF